MKFEFWVIAFKNILRHWRKSLITGSCITLGFCGIVLLGGYMIRMENYLTTQGIYLNHVGHISIYKRMGLERHLVEPERYSFNPNEQAIIKNALAKNMVVEEVGYFIHGQGLVTNGCLTFPFLAWASEPKIENYLRNHPEVLSRIPLLTKIPRGHGFWESEKFQSQIVVTKKLSGLLQKNKMWGERDDRLELQEKIIEDCQLLESKKIIHSHSGVQLLGQMIGGGMAMADSNIVGQFTTGFALSEDNSILMPLNFAQNFYGTDKISSIAVFLKERSQLKAFQNWLKQESDKWNFQVDLYPYYDYRVNPFYVGAMRFVYIMNLFFFFIVCGVIVISLINSMQIAMLERKTEIGTLLSIGYRKSQIRHLFEYEVFILASFSLLFGILLSVLLANLVNAMEFKFDIVGNAESLKLILELDWRYISLMMLIFLILVYVSTSLICRKYLKTSMLRLMERID